MNFLNQATGLPIGVKVSLEVRDDRAPIIVVRRECETHYAVNAKELWGALKSMATTVAHEYYTNNKPFNRTELIRFIAEKETVLKYFSTALATVKKARLKRMTLTGRKVRV